MIYADYAKARRPHASLKVFVTLLARCHAIRTFHEIRKSYVTGLLRQRSKDQSCYRVSIEQSDWANLSGAEGIK